MSFFRPKHPLLRAVLAVGSAVWYLVQWRRDNKRVAQPGKMVDASATVVEEKKSP